MVFNIRKTRSEMKTRFREAGDSELTLPIRDMR